MASRFLRKVLPRGGRSSTPLVLQTSGVECGHFPTPADAAPPRPGSKNPCTQESELGTSLQKDSEWISIRRCCSQGDIIEGLCVSTNGSEPQATDSSLLIALSFRLVVSTDTDVSTSRETAGTTSTTGDTSYPHRHVTNFSFSSTAGPHSLFRPQAPLLLHLPASPSILSPALLLHSKGTHPSPRLLFSSPFSSLPFRPPPALLPPIACALPLSLSRSFASTPRSSSPLLPLNDLQPAKGSTHVGKRLGRGIGSGKGKTAGRGHKGQKSRSGRKPRIGFEGGQTPLRLRLPKRGFHNPFSLDFQVVNLKDVVAKIKEEKIDPKYLITMKTLKEAGLGGKAMRDGVKLLARGAETVDIPLHFEVSRVSESAKEAVEAAGGTVTRVHYNTLGLRALLKPEWFVKKGRFIPRPARPPPRIVQLGLIDAVGRLPAPIELVPAAAAVAS